MSLDPLLEPFQLKHLTLKNRIMSTAHEPNYSQGGLPLEQYRLYHEEKAKGGIALTMTAGSAIVSPDSPEAFGNLHAYRDEIVAPLSELAESCHAHGCAVMIQITHLGWRTNWNKGDWLPVLAPSPVREPAHRAFPKEMEDWDIDRIVADYAAAAQRMQAAGLDGIEIEAYGHLFDAFWSPYQNRREDAYGGDLENRMRFSWRVIDAVREAVGPDFIFGLRMVADEQFEQGLSREDGVEIARRFARSGKIDFLNLIRGRVASDALLTNVIPIQGMASSPHLDFAGEVKSAVAFPVFHAAKIADVPTARHAVASGKLDMVGMTRAHIADPHIVEKTKRGEEGRIRPCVGATYCLDRIYEGGQALCIHNAATGREAQMPHDIPHAQQARRVVVIGAGPAGLEAARVAGERGHEVIVLEAADRAGGQINLLTANPRRRDLVGIIDWRLAELERLGAELRYNTFAEVETVTALHPDVVVVATGGLPQAPEMEGAHLTVSSWEILSGEIKPAANVLLFDDNGGHQGMSAAEMIARSGANLELISPERFFAPEMGGMNHVPYMRAFHEAGTRVTINTRVGSVEREGNRLKVTLRSDYASDWAEERRVDQVVVEHGTMANDDLYHALRPFASNGGAIDYAALLSGEDTVFPELRAGAFLLYRIGDAVASRNIHAGIYDAVRMGLHH